MKVLIIFLAVVVGVIAWIYFVGWLLEKSWTGKKYNLALALLRDAFIFVSLWLFAIICCVFTFDRDQFRFLFPGARKILSKFKMASILR